MLLLLDFLAGDRDQMRRATLVGLGSTSLDIFGPRSEVLHNVDGTRLVQSSEDTTYPYISHHIPQSQMPRRMSQQRILGSGNASWIFMGFHGVVCVLQASEACIGMTC